MECHNARSLIVPKKSCKVMNKKDGNNYFKNPLEGEEKSKKRNMTNSLFSRSMIMLCLVLSLLLLQKKDAYNNDVIKSELPSSNRCSRKLGESSFLKMHKQFAYYNNQEYEPRYNSKGTKQKYSDVKVGKIIDLMGSGDTMNYNWGSYNEGKKNVSGDKLFTSNNINRKNVHYLTDASANKNKDMDETRGVISKNSKNSKHIITEKQLRETIDNLNEVVHYKDMINIFNKMTNIQRNRFNEMQQNLLEYWCKMARYNDLPEEYIFEKWAKTYKIMSLEIHSFEEEMIYILMDLVHSEVFAQYIFADCIDKIKYEWDEQISKTDKHWKNYFNEKVKQHLMHSDFRH
ncbi:Plasmodium exported protein (PHIST), unknown function [Plasmodium ovale wallikeri]|uniref:Plasmodium RESA N-terminal domain-containing protein n=1 Tax=Plasmodium ovale wallikeri TaxID=864142 RepID=A0A1A9AGS7_PLAOA|nr:Plasmodium exported protein (PHIST), unknown function [Plasmodium ovale wallikeri]SBT55308.1 Plasmodium exported protein (PHIST), unknown function [Plasmodium ovale wallikeri]